MTRPAKGNQVLNPMLRFEGFLGIDRFDMVSLDVPPENGVMPLTVE